jgi:hypothetical protein
MEAEELRKEIGVYLRPTTPGDAGNLGVSDITNVQSKENLTRF